MGIGWLGGRARSGTVCVNWQRVCLGVATAGHQIDVWVTNDVLQFFDGDHLLRTERRNFDSDVRAKQAQRPSTKTRATN